MQLRRRRFLTAAAAAFGSIGIARFPAGAAEFSFKLANDEPTTHPVSVFAMEAAEKIKNDTGGRLEITVYPFSELGGSTQLLSQLRLGAIECTLLGDLTFSNIVPVVGISSLPFLFSNSKHAWDTRDGALGSYLRGALEKAGILALDKTWDSGIRQVCNNVRPVVVPDDLKGLKLRIPVVPTMVDMFKALGASPLPLNANEVYSALQTHVVDGCEFPYAVLETNKYYEVVKYCSQTNHIWTLYTFAVNSDKWRALPKNLRDAAERRFNDAGVAERIELARMDNSLAAQLKTQGMIFNSTDPALFRAAVRKAGLYAKWKSEFPSEAWSILEKSVGTLT